MKVTVETLYGPIEAEYVRGSMVELTNLGEIINIVDHAKGGKDPRIETKEGLKQIVEEWAVVQEDDAEGFDWYNHYLSHR